MLTPWGCIWPPKQVPGAIWDTLGVQGSVHRAAGYQMAPAWGLYAPGTAAGDAPQHLRCMSLPCFNT